MILFFLFQSEKNTVDIIPKKELSIEWSVSKTAQNDEGSDDDSSDDDCWITFMYVISCQLFIYVTISNFKSVI